MLNKQFAEYLSKQTLPIKLNIKVKTKAKNNSILNIDMQANSIVIQINAIPQNNNANKELIRFLKDIIPIKCEIKILKGFKSHNKIIYLYK